jgi:transposase
MWNSLIDSDPSARILTARIAKEELRKLLALARTDASRDQIASRLPVFYGWCACAEIDELTTLATTVETWWPVPRCIKWVRSSSECGSGVAG